MPDLVLNLEDHQKILYAKSILDKEYHRHHTQADLVRMAGINEFALKKGFKQLTGMTLHQYVTWVRVERAKDLLLNTCLPLKLIAKKIGLNERNLTKGFIKLTNTTPAEWKRQQRKNVKDDW